MHVKDSAGIYRVLNHQRCTPDAHLRSRMVHLLELPAPATIDLTQPLLPGPFIPCWNQLAEGSCGPHTAGEAICILAERSGIRLGYRPSPRFIYFATRKLMGTLTQDSGVDNNVMFRALGGYGWCDENLMPYTDDPAMLAVAPSAAAIAQAVTRKLPAPQLVGQSLQDIQSALQAGEPLVFAFDVPQEFMSTETANTGIMAMPKSSKNVGGHDVTLCGVTTVDQPGVEPGKRWPANTIKVRNHWYNGSKAWGDAGYGYIPLAFALDPHWASDGGKFFAVTGTGLPVPVPPAPPVPPTPPVPTPTVLTWDIPGYRITAVPAASDHQ